jgi:hypothetical protein
VIFYKYFSPTGFEDAVIVSIQLTTDGHRAYLVAVEDAFGVDIDCWLDFSEVVKQVLNLATCV